MSNIKFLKLSLVLLGSCLFPAANTQADTFPADIPRCHSGDTDCVLRTTLNILRQYSRKGYPAAAFPIIEPFHLNEFDLSDGSSLGLKLIFRNVDVVGLSAAKFDRAVGFGADPKTSKFELYGSLPKISIRGKYTADGRILILPIRGDGDADIVLDNPKVSVKFKPSTHSKNGKTYLSVNKLKVLIEPQRLNIKLANLFNGDQGLGAHMNEFLNENWGDVWTELQPSIHNTIAEVLKSVLTPVFKKFAYEDLFEDLDTQ